MNERDCNNCVYNRPFWGKNYKSTCVAWSCEYINYKEAVEAYKEKHNAEEVQE